jgi:mono/diheme cytochrome c family protein
MHSSASEGFMRILAVIGALAVIAAVGAAVVFFGGFYSVAGSVEDPAIVNWALVQVRTASINRHAHDQPPATINNPATIQAGAREFAEHGCANCHGAPGVNWAKFSEGLRPDPPDLKEVVNDLTPSQLFWVIKNGINMTGMPSFALAGAKDEEIWSIVAFLKKLPSIKEDDYKAWTVPPAAAAPAAAPAPVPTPPAPGASEPPAPKQ